MDEKDLIEKFLQGSEEAFTTLYSKYFSLVYNYVASVVSQDFVEDIVQEIFIAFMDSIKNFRFESTLTKWLLSIAKNKITDHYRKNSTLQNKQIVYNNLLYNPETALNRVENPIDSVENKLMLSSVFTNLPQHYAEILFLRFTMDLDFQTISKRLGIEYKAATSLFKRAIDACKEEFKKLGII